jgi:ParB family chromosome partitioning protein
VITGQLTMGHARALLALESAARIKDARDQVVKKQFSVRQTEALVKKLKGGEGKAPRKTPIDPELADLSARLQRCLGTKVNIQPQARGGKGGKIEISYYSPEEFERLLDIFEGR